MENVKIENGVATLKQPKRKKRRGVEQLRSLYGRMFVLPWEIGLILFFVIPLVSSIIYSFSTVTIDNGVTTEFVGLKWYKYIINEDPNYLNNLKSAVGNMLVQMPIIIALSLILAIVLNQKFKGRVVARAIFFLPVIIATGVIIDLLTSEQIGISLVASTGGDGEAAYGSMIDFDAILGNLGLPEEVNKLMSGYIGSIFNLLWNCGIQIVLFIAGLQTIPDQLYEVSKVEGASKWEEFWYITFPMLGQTLLLIIVYTMIDLFTQKQGIMKNAFDLMSEKQIYDRSSAMLWFYFLIVGAVLAAVLGLYHKFCLKRWS